MDGKSPLSHARNAESALQAIFEDCERDARCASAFPDLRSEWKSLHDLLQQSKLVVDTGNVRKVIDVDEQLRACSVWPGTDVPESFFEPVVSDVPLLLLAGGRDHTLPAETANSIAKGFQNSKLVIVEEMGHVPDAISNLECLDRIMLDFLAAPLAPLESGCVQDMRAPPFEVPTDID